MANDFDQFPLYDNLVKRGSSSMSDVWVDSMATFYQNLIGYLSQFGIFLPLVTTAQRDTIDSPANGQTIYNTTVDAPQFWQSSTNSWRTITFT